MTVSTLPSSTPTEALFRVPEETLDATLDPTFHATGFATCPLPPIENGLAVAIKAGEKTPLERNPRA